ncbi:MAG: molybdopterin cofactor-binding domain-containing protein [Steroidobacteraceae bacterium]
MVRTTRVLPESPTGAPLNLSRRTFLSASLAAGGGLLLTVSLPGIAEAGLESLDPQASATRLSAYILIARDGLVTIMARSPDMGQGMKTTLPMVIADELDVPWTSVHVETAPVNPALYGMQFSYGSMNTPLQYDPMRRAGAAGRQMMLTAATRLWHVPASECETDQGVVHHRASGRRAAYGELASRAARLPAPDLATVPLKDPKDYKIIGHFTPQVDGPRVLAGEPLFGIDQSVPGMLYAVYEKAPVFGSRALSANLDVIKAQPGVRDAFIIHGNPEETMSAGLVDGVAIVAERWHQANRALELLQVQWEPRDVSQQATAVFDRQAAALADEAPRQILRQDGDVNQAFDGAAKVVEASYAYPFLAHATLEPMNCTAWAKPDGSVEIWAPSQAPTAALLRVARTLKLDASKVTVHMTRVGGGFGRRGNSDYAVEAAAISQRIGQPVKLLWNRQQDIQHDFYRPAGYHHFRGALDARGHLVGFADHFVTFSHGGQVALCADLPLDMFPAGFVPNLQFGQTMIELGAPTGHWRDPNYNGLAYAFESFIDELAHAGGRDPLALRLELYGPPRVSPAPPSHMPGLHIPPFDTGRACGVLQLVAEKAGWAKRQLPPRTGMGLAFCYSHFGYVAEVIKASVDERGVPRIHKVWAAVDIGRQIINPAGAYNQAQGAILDGLGSALHQAITIRNGAVVDTNFNTFGLLRMREAPPVEVHFRVTDNHPTGLGEPTLAPAMPALANALFAATGKRIRRLPIDPELLRS